MLLGVCARDSTLTPFHSRQLVLTSACARPMEQARRGPAERPITHQVKHVTGATRSGAPYHTWLHQALSPSTKSKHQASQAFEMTFKLGTSLSLAVLHARRNRLIVTIHLSRKFPVLEFWHESLCLHNVGAVGFKSVSLHSFQCGSKHVVSTGLLIWGLDLEFNSHQFNYSQDFFFLCQL